MSEENRTLTRQLIVDGDFHHSGGSVCQGEDNLESQFFDRRLSSSELDTRINAIAAALATLLETLIQSVRELSERRSNHSTEGNTPSERSRSSGQRFDTRPTKT